MMEVSRKIKLKKTKKMSLRKCIEQCKICGSRFLRLNKSRHNRTKTHLDAKHIWFDMYAINEFIDDLYSQKHLNDISIFDDYRI